MNEITKSPGKATEAIPQVTADYTRVSKGLFGFGCKIKPTAEHHRNHFHLSHLMGRVRFFPSQMSQS